MNRRSVWIGIATFVLALLIVLPVRWIAGFLPPEAKCKAWKGSVWRGECAELTLQQPGQPPLPVELLRWRLRPAALLRLSLEADVEVRTAQGSGSGRVELGRGGRLAMQDVTATAVFDRRLATMLAAGWNGQLQAQHLTMRVQGKKLQELSGELTLRDFNDGRGGALGSYRLVFPLAGRPPFAGMLQDDGGPLEVRASLTITADRQWTLDGKVMPRAGTPEALRRQLEYLGGPDAGGRYPLSMAGTFK